VKSVRVISPPGTYFVTSMTWQRINLFAAEPMARLFLQTLYSYRRQGNFRLHAFVLMPDHFHLLLTTEAIPLERVLQFIKDGYRDAVRERSGSTMEIWERGFTDHRIRNAEDFEHHRLYIHRDPVERKLVVNPSEFRYCSAFPGFVLDSWHSAAEAGIFIRLDDTIGRLRRNSNLRLHLVKSPMETRCPIAALKSARENYFSDETCETESARTPVSGGNTLAQDVSPG
jgi:putative transposase